MIHRHKNCIVPYFGSCFCSCKEWKMGPRACHQQPIQSDLVVERCGDTVAAFYINSRLYKSAPPTNTHTFLKGLWSQAVNRKPIGPITRYKLGKVTKTQLWMCFSYAVHQAQCIYCWTCWTKSKLLIWFSLLAAWLQQHLQATRQSI